MKTKIFNALKQEYAPLGLGDNILSGLADMLASTSLVTDENLQSIVAGQKAYLEGLQKSNDKRVQDAVTKTQSEAEKSRKEALDKLQKDFDAYKTAHPEQRVEDKEIPEWYKQKEAERAAKEKEYQEKIDALEKAKAAAEQEKAAAEAKRAAAERTERINKKAKDKGIPDWLISRGFGSLPADADDAAIETYLAEYANEIKTNFLPGKSHQPQKNNPTQAEKEVAESIASKMLPGFGKKE